MRFAKIHEVEDDQVLFTVVPSPHEDDSGVLLEVTTVVDGLVYYEPTMASLKPGATIEDVLGDFTYELAVEIINEVKTRTA